MKFVLSLVLVCMMACCSFAQVGPPKTCAEATAAVDALEARLNALIDQRADYVGILNDSGSILNQIDSILADGSGFGDCVECSDILQCLLGEAEGLRDEYDSHSSWLDNQEFSHTEQQRLADAISGFRSNIGNNPGSCTEVYYAATGWASSLADYLEGVYSGRVSSANYLLDGVLDLLDAANAGCECSGGGEGDPE